MSLIVKLQFYLVNYGTILTCIMDHRGLTFTHHSILIIWVQFWEPESERNPGLGLFSHICREKDSKSDFRYKVALNKQFFNVDSEGGIRSKGRGFKSRLIQYLMEMVLIVKHSKPCQGRLLYLILFIFEKNENIGKQNKRLKKD
jgi:hypothetical protein